MVAMEILLIKEKSFLKESTCDVMCSARSKPVLYILKLPK